MNKFFIFLSVFFISHTSLALSKEPLTENYNDSNIKKITKYLVNIPDSIKSETDTDNPGVGSSLKLKNIDQDGNIWLYSITDRGMNIEAPDLTTGESVKIFPKPSFSPFISLIKVTPNQSAIVEKIIKIQASGIPIPNTMSSAKLEQPLTSDLKKIKNDLSGIDPEGLDVDSQGNFWVVDEYGPALIKISNDGKIIKRIDVSNGLPKIVTHRMRHRGIEAVAVTPSGKIILVMESVLDINGETKNLSNFIRFIEFDPTTDKTRMLAYTYDKDTYASPSSVKIGDIVALDDKSLLVIEQGKTKDGKMRNTIQKVNINNATDITNMKLPNGKELEYANQQELGKINMVRKEFIIDVCKYGWPFEKLEGIAYIDPYHIAIIDDNNFGYSHKLLNTQDQNNKNYKIDLKNKTVLYKGQPSNAIISHKRTGIDTELWIIELQNPIK